MTENITNYDELFDFSLNTELTDDDIRNLLRESLGIWLSKDVIDKKKLVKELIFFIEEYPTKSNRPLFLDVLDKDIKVTDFGYKKTNHN